MQLSKPDTKNGPGRTVMMIIFSCLLVASFIVAYIPWGVIDKWTENVANQVIIFCGFVVMFFAVVVFCKIKKW